MSLLSFHPLGELSLRRRGRTGGAGAVRTAVFAALPERYIKHIAVLSRKVHLFRSG